MTLARSAVLGLAFLLAAPRIAAAEDLADVSERIFEISPIAGAFIPDSNTRYDATSPLVGVRGTLNNSPYWGIEANISVSPGQRQIVTRGMLESYRWQPGYDSNDAFTGFVISDMQTTEVDSTVDSTLLMFGGSLVVNLTKKRFRPFLSAGGGFIDDRSNRKEDPPSPYSNFYADLGVGLKWHRKSGWAWRVEVRDLLMRRDDLPRPNENAALLAAQTDLNTTGGNDGVIGREEYDPIEYRAKRWLHNWALSLSVTFPFGWVWKDGDGDQIEDRFDDCLTTAPGVVVDQVGCGIDTDQDGVFDGLDQCDEWSGGKNTPLGATVDLVGCPSDSDRDEVLDGLDQCPDTPLGALVDLVGCPRDSDSDGVLDGLDACDDTPLGAAIDEVGCVADELEGMLLRGETIVVSNVNFEPGSGEIKPRSYHYVNKIGRLLEKWTGNEDNPLKIEIGIHTDGTGSSDLNADLSRRRAEAIRIYMLENFFDMGANNLVAVGYGEAFPIADDTTEEGRALNRRAEIRMIGPGDFPEPYDFGATVSDEAEFGAPADEIDGVEDIEPPSFDDAPDAPDEPAPEPEQ